MRYVALLNFELHLKRVIARAKAGGHSAPISVLRGIYDSSLRNLRAAPKFVDRLLVYDNSAAGGPARFIAQAENGVFRFIADESPDWFAQAFDLK